MNTIEKVIQYLELRFRHTLLTSEFILAKAGAALSTFLLIFICFLVAFVFASVGLAFVIADWTDSFSLGFALVSIIFIIIGLIIYLFRRVLAGIINRKIELAIQKMIHSNQDQILNTNGYDQGEHRTVGERTPEITRPN